MGTDNPRSKDFWTTLVFSDERSAETRLLDTVIPPFVINRAVIAPEGSAHREELLRTSITLVMREEIAVRALLF